MTQYIVALRFTQKADAYAGVVTWSTFDSKNEFHEWFKKSGHVEQEIVEEGITEARAIELTKTTPLRSYAAVATFEATDPVTGRVNQAVLDSKVREIGFVPGSIRR